VEIISCDDSINVGALGEIDGLTFVVTFNLIAKEPMELSKVSNLNMLRNLMFKGYDE